MSIKTFHAIIIIILATSYMHVAVATEVLNPAGDMFEAESGGRLRADSWSQRPEVSRAIAMYKTEVEKLDDVFATCEMVWQTQKLPEGQPFIDDIKDKDETCGESASNKRFMYIVEVALCLESLTHKLKLLTAKIDGEDYDATLQSLEKVRIQTINNILYCKVNGSDGRCMDGMRAHGMSFSTVTNPKWRGESALTRFEKIIGIPCATRKGSLQRAFEALLETIDTKAY